MREITVQLSDSMYDLLRDAAHRRGASVSSVASAAVANVAREYDRPFAQLVIDEHAKRKSVPQIAAALGVTNKRVQDAHRALHLTPNPIPKVADRLRKPQNRRATP